MTGDCNKVDNLSGDAEDLGLSLRFPMTEATTQLGICPIHTYKLVMDERAISRWLNNYS